MRRITKAFPDTSWQSHLYTTYEAARLSARAFDDPTGKRRRKPRTGMRSPGTRKILPGTRTGRRVVSFLTEWHAPQPLTPPRRTERTRDCWPLYERAVGRR